MTPSKSPAQPLGVGALGGLHPLPLAHSPLPPTCPPIQVLLFLQEEKEKIGAATQVTPGSGALNPPAVAPGTSSSPAVWPTARTQTVGPATAGRPPPHVGSLLSHETLAEISTPASRPPLREH